jgi:hypothetical protein
MAHLTSTVQDERARKRELRTVKRIEKTKAKAEIKSLSAKAAEPESTGRLSKRKRKATSDS